MCARLGTLYAYLLFIIVKFSSIAVSKAGWRNGLVSASRIEVSEFVVARSNLCSSKEIVLFFFFYKENELTISYVCDFFRNLIGKI